MDGKVITNYLRRASIAAIIMVVILIGYTHIISAFSVKNNTMNADKIPAIYNKIPTATPFPTQNPLKGQLQERITEINHEIQIYTDDGKQKYTDELSETQVINNAQNQINNINETNSCDSLSCSVGQIDNVGSIHAEMNAEVALRTNDNIAIQYDLNKIDQLNAEKDQIMIQLSKME